MKWAVLPLCLLGVASAAELTETHTVYLLPMVHSLDQFIANRLTRMQVLQVETDPAKADSVLTDHVGPEFESRLDALYPKPKPPKEVKKEAKEAAKEGTETKEAPDTEKKEDKPATPLPPFGNTANKVETAGNMATFGRGRGTIFLVDVKSRRVLWSVFEKPKDFQPRTLDRTAERIVKLLKADLEPKKQ